MRRFSNIVDEMQGQTYTLRKRIAAIQASPADAPPFGPVIQLPPSSNVTVLGPAFNESLVKVRCHDTVYFVFIEDLAEPLVRA
jgi:hypothetical protein